MAPIGASKIPGLARWETPMDGGLTFRGKQLLGPHKTWRGFASGIVVATLTFWVQQLLFHHFEWIRTISDGVDYATLPTLLVGPLFGIGALGGDAVKSFFKRQVGVPSGHSWIPFDQIDYIVGTVVLTLPFVKLHSTQYLLILLVWFVLHLVASYIGWLLKLKDAPI